MKCPACGKDNPDDTISCPVCYEYLGKAQPAQAPVAAPNPVQAPPDLEEICASMRSGREHPSEGSFLEGHPIGKALILCAGCLGMLALGSHALRPIEVAPKPDIQDRLSRCWDRRIGKEAERIKATLAATRRLAAGLSAKDARALDALDDLNERVAQRYLDWLKRAPDQDLPPIAYGFPQRRALGVYQPTRDGKDTITINHACIDDPPELQATVMAHELYHYWDHRLSKNSHNELWHDFYPTQAAELEYAAYGLSKAFFAEARQALPAGAALTAHATAFERFAGEIPDFHDLAGIKGYVERVEPGSLPAL